MASSLSAKLRSYGKLFVCVYRDVKVTFYMLVVITYYTIITKINSNGQFIWSMKRFCFFVLLSLTDVCNTSV